MNNGTKLNPSNSLSSDNDTSHAAARAVETQVSSWCSPAPIGLRQ